MEALSSLRRIMEYGMEAGEPQESLHHCHTCRKAQPVFNEFGGDFVLKLTPFLSYKLFFAAHFCNNFFLED